MAPVFDPFAALDLPRDASTETIRLQYRRLARRYHPNRHQLADSNSALSEQFHTVHQAWKHLADPDKRRRYLVFLRFAEEQEDLLARMADLLSNEGNKAGKEGEQHEPGSGYVSSEPDDDVLPHIGLTRRRTVLERAMSVKKPMTDPAMARTSAKRDRSHHARSTQSEMADGKTKEADYFSLRRKELERLRRKELLAFEKYRRAMVKKFETELEVEQTCERYERSKWQREYFERAPRQTTERLRSFQHFMSAYRAFGQQPLRRRASSIISDGGGQILSTEDLVETGSYLAPDTLASSTRTRSLHKRGYSSDITADHSSSDENEDSVNATVGLYRAWHRRHDRNTTIDLFQLPYTTHKDHIGNDTSSSPGPFRMVVKQPTGLDDRMVEQDSSPESGSGTSRSPSPAPVDDGNSFTLVNSRRLAEALNPGRRRSPSPYGRDQRLPRSNSASRRSSPESQDTGAFMIKPVEVSLLSHIPVNQVHVLGYTEKANVLGVAADAEIDPSALLERLTRLDANVAANFMLKPDTKESFIFRLIYENRNVSERNRSFIALSYRRRVLVQKHHDYYTLPLEKALFKAVLDERASSAEGLWIDQICIDGTSRDETTISMSAMDMVYRSARIVVVALDDIHFDAHEGEMLENHMAEFAKLTHVPARKRFRGKERPYLGQHDEMYQVLRKLLRSSWFKRAWCRHEMRLAREHVFLVPCKSPGSWSGHSVVRFTGACLTHLLGLASEVPFESDIEQVKPALHAFFRDRNKLVAHERHLNAHHGNFTTVVAEVFSMETGGDPRIPPRQRAADALKDKISIILNTMECGLAITPAMRDPGMSLTKAECQYMLLTMALAAQDPGALCSVGPPMRLVQADTDSPLSPTASSTWLFEPTNVDSGLNNYRTLNRLDPKARIETGVSAGEHFVQLDLKFLQSGPVRRGCEDARSLEIACNIIHFCQDQKLGRNRGRYLIADASANRHFGSMFDVYSQTLACVYECGPDWVEDVCMRYGVSRWRRDGESAWNLLVALRNTYGKWPQSAWDMQAAAFIMDFVNFLVIRGMPQRHILHYEEWRPVWVATENGGKILTYAPSRAVCPAIPTALLDPDYVNLARLWLLEPRESHGVDGRPTSRWTILGKSVIFSDDLAEQQLDSRGGACSADQMVFGREDPEIQRLLRERSMGFPS
ncbi:hypothetical protein BAUCODRAFT_31988 [Baudoinia panamericana UAMH 10762]|uniref:J domain-containing protein n=1 Tax=Baudoinia panamericana (strain UAMH 10762) TaxID=717646 RepID=M2MMR5_BAUPA|nr:uncharacterized protein BAUCODRAFT_31988 [Baudoinia panamericana UAMH 10762]EMC97981.1 hypothetical protein BAUCODRAFT_31988 [Baudoinia panamericana UAMH 10762]